MNRIDLTNLGGFPLEQDTLKFMQDAYGDMFASLAALVGDKIIISGVNVAGGNVTGGWISYAGEIIKFVGGAAGPGVVISESSQNAVFEDGGARPVYKTRTAAIGSPATFPFADLKRLDTLIQQAEAFSALVLAFNLHNHSYDNLANLPVAKIVHKAIHQIGDINPTDMSQTITHNQNIAPGSYYVLGTLWANDSNFNQHNDVAWILFDKQVNSFKIGLKDLGQVVQNLRFEYIIIKL